MREVHYEPREILDAAGVRSPHYRRGGSTMRKLLRWVSAHTVRLVEDCPECGATEELGAEHGTLCEHHPLRATKGSAS